MTHTAEEKDPLDPLWDKADEAAKNGDIAGALFVWKAIADKGVWQTYARIGYLYERGATGVERDVQQALHWYRKAVFEGDDPIAHVGLGRAYYLGTGIEKNLASARHHFEKAYVQGSVDSALYLGTMYFRGDGVERDIRSAEKYLKVAAAAEYYAAYALLARIAFADGRLLKGISLLARSWLLGFKILRKDPLDPRLLGIG